LEAERGAIAFDHVGDGEDNLEYLAYFVRVRFGFGAVIELLEGRADGLEEVNVWLCILHWLRMNVIENGEEAGDREVFC
jgi:hypothetical protein